MTLLLDDGGAGAAYVPRTLTDAELTELEFDWEHLDIEGPNGVIEVHRKRPDSDDEYADDHEASAPPPQHETPRHEAPRRETPRQRAERDAAKMRAFREAYSGTNHSGPNFAERTRKRQQEAQETVAELRRQYDEMMRRYDLRTNPLQRDIYINFMREARRRNGA